jgi:predicted nuclease of predicted toxin-antitoxin system
VLILLDENLPHRLRLLISGHDVRTVAFQGWKALSNGALLAAAEETGFDIIVTADQGIRYQQNLEGRRIGIVILSSNEREVIIRQVERIIAGINAAKPGTFTEIDCGS